MKELELVKLTVDVPEHGLRRGDVGTIVFVHAGGEAYEVEFVACDGGTVAVLSLPASRVCPLGGREIAHARPLAS
jgi:hypothetical protein